MATSRDKLTANIDAIEIALKLGSEIPTPEQRRILQQYEGFGDLKCILLDPKHPERFAKSEQPLIPLVERLHEVINSNSPTQFNSYYASLRASVLTSFYTPYEIISAIDNAFVNNRLTFGNVLDPSAGNGAFTSIKGDNYTLVEKDLITSKILAALHPDKKVIAKGFEDIPARYNNSFNLVISNIPFGDFKVFDAAYINSNNANLSYSTNAVHTYFFHKGLDTLRNGGLLAYIAPTGIMDARAHENYRKHLLSRAHLISTVRLPENTFDSTKAQSDLIILQKDNNRSLSTLLSPLEESFIRTTNVGNNIFINELYAVGNERVAATQSRVDTNMYGQPDIRYVHENGMSGIAAMMQMLIESDIRENINRRLFISHNQSVQSTTNRPVQLSLFDTINEFPTIKKEEEEPKTFPFENKEYDVAGCFQVADNHVGISNGDGTANFYEGKNEDVKQLIRDYVSLRDSYYTLKNFENEFLRENSLKRSNLNKAYETFINTPYSLAVLHRQITLKDAFDLLRNEPSYIELKGLEIDRDGKISKADIFFQPVAFGREKDIYTAQEALNLCRNKYNAVDMDYLHSLTRLDDNQILEELHGQIFKNPETMKYETSDIFLSGNVVEKYDAAVKALYENPADYNIQAAVNALKNVIPAKIPFHEIGVNLGERWMPEKYFADFASHIFKSKAQVKYNSVIDQFSVNTNATYYVIQKYSVQTANRYYSSSEVFLFAMIDTIPEMTKKIGYGKDAKTVPDTEGIEKMNATILGIQKEWKQWCENLPSEEKFKIEDIYNRKFNCFIRPQFDGSFQDFPDLDLSRINIKELYPSQKDAILRVKCNGGGIIDHTVGGGKTAIMCISAYEMKRLGIVNKPLIIGMKANTSEVADTFRKIYPEANLLYAGEKEFGKKQRENFLIKIQNNNFDCIIMTHEQFKCIPQASDIELEVLTEELNKIDEALYALKQGDFSFKRAEKELEKAKQNRIAQIKAIHYKINQQRDNVVDFKNMGIDHIFCDESHKFKNTSIKTRHTRVAGIGNTQGSQRSHNMKIAIRTIQNRTGRDLGATFLSGTTIVNSLTEMYALFEYLRPKSLAKQNILSFDAWASVFTKKTKEIEFNVTNELLLKERFREFVKVPELALFYSEITDFKTAEDIGLDRPVKNEILVAIEQTEEQKDMFNRLKEFAKTGDGKVIYREELTANEKTAKMLIATNTARKASMDLRLIDDKRFSEDSSNRTKIVADKAYEYYEKYNPYKGTQFIFSDLGIYKGKDTFSIYGDIKEKLIEKGIPGNEIQFIQDYNTDKQRENLFKQMNDGKVRILIGSTEKLGTGVNAQERCVAIHHVNIPWTPKDFEQRNGRGIRKGNRVAKMFAGNKVDVLIYATKETLDTYQFNLVQNKAHFISQIKNNNINVRTLDEGAMDENNGLSYADYIAVLSGNIDLLDKAKVEREIMQYKAEEKVFLDNGRERDFKIKNLTADLKHTNNCLEKFNIDNETYKAIPKDEKGFPLSGATVGDKCFYEAKNFGEELNRVLDKPNKNTMSYVQIGTFGNFNLLIIAEKLTSESNQEIYGNRLFVQGNLKYQYNKGSVARTAEIAGKYPINALNRIENSLIPQYTKLASEQTQKIEAYRAVEYIFPNKDKLEAAEARLVEIKARLEKKYGAGKTSELSFEMQHRTGFRL